jgi:hypothetical protein
MSRRLTSPQAAARHAARAARQSAKLRRESWKSWLLVTSAVLAACAALALYAWARLDFNRKALQRQQQRRLHTHSPALTTQTNGAVSLPDAAPAHPP